jgi:hypothetical protein
VPVTLSQEGSLKRKATAEERGVDYGMWGTTIFRRLSNQYIHKNQVTNSPYLSTPPTPSGPLPAGPLPTRLEPRVRPGR